MKIMHSPFTAAVILALCSFAAAQSPATHEPVKTLETKVFAVLRAGDTKAFLAYVPETGVSLGRDAPLTTRAEIKRQLHERRGLVCKLFDSACLKANEAQCSYRELLTASEQVHTASSEVTRSGVRQAVLVARVENRRCPDQKLIDFIFNLQGDSWQLFSIP